MSTHWVMNKTAYSSESNSRSQARKRKDIVNPSNICESCGETGKFDVHNVDENPFNNDVGNFKKLFRSCHMKLHRKKGLCKVCGNPVMVIVIAKSIISDLKNMETRISTTES